MHKKKGQTTAPLHSTQKKSNNSQNTTESNEGFKEKTTESVDN